MIYKIPIVWQMTKVVEVQAESLEEACGKAVEDAGSDGGDYICDSMEACEEEAWDLNPEPVSPA